MNEYIILVKELGFPIAISLILLYFLIQRGSKKLDEIKEILHTIACNVGKTYLNGSQTIQVFHWCLSDHIYKKLKLAKAILIENDIHNRKDQIKKNLSAEYKKITIDGARKLSEFNTPAGDLGHILMNVDFDKFMKEVFDIFFSDSSVDTKCIDLSSLMANYVNQLISEIEIKISK